MSPPAFSDKKVSAFPIFSKKEWANAAKQELEGADPVAKLKHRIDELDIFPYYDSSDQPLNDFQLPVSQNEFSGPRTWSNLPLITVNDAKEANEHALISLHSGADGLFFELLGPVDPDVLLKKIEMPYCSIVFSASGGQEDFFRKFVTFASARNANCSGLAGAIFWKDPPVNLMVLNEQFKGWSEFRYLGIIGEELNSPTDEIAMLLAKAAAQLADFTEGTEKINEVLDSVAFSISVGTDFFLEIAKLKALRLLWFQVAKTYDPQCSATGYIHVTVKAVENQAYSPHGNMIRGTTAAMSAILGGCDGLTVTPADQQSEMMTRIARNVSSILREESHLAKVSDPIAGSYYIEKLTEQLAVKAWEKFQRLMQ